jgi:hypothetical protein
MPRPTRTIVTKDGQRLDLAIPIGISPEHDPVSLREDRQVVPTRWAVKKDDHYAAPRYAGAPTEQRAWTDDLELEQARREEQRSYRRAQKANENYVPLQKRPGALLLWVKERVQDDGYELDDLLAVVRRGTPPSHAIPKLDVLARVVADLRRAGVALAVIGEAIGLERRVVARLEKRDAANVARVEHEDRALREERRRPCRRHDVFRSDCPACLRNAPEEGLPEQPTGRMLGASS